MIANSTIAFMATTASYEIYPVGAAFNLNASTTASIQLTCFTFVTSSQPPGLTNVTSIITAPNRSILQEYFDTYNQSIEYSICPE